MPALNWHCESGKYQGSHLTICGISADGEKDAKSTWNVNNIKRMKTGMPPAKDIYWSTEAVGVPRLRRRQRGGCVHIVDC